jgi:hypothetical protein
MTSTNTHSIQATMKRLIWMKVKVLRQKIASIQIALFNYEICIWQFLSVNILAYQSLKDLYR